MSTSIISQDASPSRLKQLTAELAEAVDKLQAERDQLLQRVVQLEAECKRVSAERSMLLHAWVNANTSDEELDRIRNQPGGRTWAEIKADLEKL